ncbi:hypothetical protein QBC38DRAFT_539844 [Podospora fimiseda]|uniref:SET domain-containing protein n=1 Tax=Podospora fimiseda TaxID=252190 RepID=A0AAN6YMK6_9PEZI|nr:hypothetical protein QBC38DRAFT_539844 [Podospora fimiseda]
MVSLYSFPCSPAQWTFFLSLLVAGTNAKYSTSRSNQCLYFPAGRLEWSSHFNSCPLPEVIATGKAPVAWSFPPNCITPPPTENKTSPKPDCLFSSTAFRNGHGISLVASTITTSHLIGIGSFNDEPLPLAAQRRESLGPAYKIVPVEGKGMGVVSARHIKRGEIIMMDYPAVLIGTSFLANSKPHHRRRILKKAIKQLPEGTRKKVEGLSRGKEEYEVDAILGPNANTVLVGEEGGGQVHVGLFAETARINHACRPNAHSRFSERRLTMEVMAHRAIKVGEEITMSYIPITTPIEERKKYLKEHWGFECTCSLCRSSPQDIEESESWRRRQKSLKATIQDATSGEFYSDAIAMSEEWLQFADWDMVHPLWPEYHDSLADLYFRNGDMMNAMRYARMAYDGWVKFGSIDDEKLENAKVLVDKLDKISEEKRR